MLETSREVLHGCFNDVTLCFRTTRFLLWSHFMLFRVPLNDCRSAASDGCSSSTATSSLRSQSNWQSKRRNASSAKGLTLAFFRRSTGVKRGTNRLKQTTREKLRKHESIKENQRLKWWKKHQHAQRKTTSSYFGASTKPWGSMNQWVNQSRTGLPTNSTSSSTVAPPETEVHNLSSRWCLALFVAVAFV